MTEVTQILSAIEQGDPHASEQLLPLIYEELRRLAAQRLARESPGQSLETTDLVHEAYLRLVDVEKAQQWNSRGHFFAAAATAMRRILIDHARHRKRRKRGGGAKRVDLDDPNLVYESTGQDLIDLEDALDRLAAEAPDAAQLVRLRHFAGLSVEEAAEMVGIARSVAYEHWAYARAWLRCRLQGDEPSAT